MRKVLFGVAGTLLYLSFGCSSYIEVRNTANRIWVMEKDGSTVLRCYDATPPGPYKGALKVFCKEAHMYGTVSNPSPDQAITIPPDEKQAPTKAAAGNNGDVPPQ